MEDRTRDTDKPHILIFFSDQHSGNRMGFMGDPLIKTPHMDRLATEGSHFSEAYTSCPLCVPARVSMLMGQLPSRTGVITNDGIIPSDKATFITALAASGYETVLCGRMHFMGPDQRHGFTKRLGGDICPTYWGFKGNLREELGILKGTMSEKGCLNTVGKGNSHVLDYDKIVVDQALEYLRQYHERPQCLVVGTYSPHFPYVAPPELYDHYRSRVQLPSSLIRGIDYPMPMLTHRFKDLDEELYLDAQAAYCGMIDYTDRLLGEVRAGWDSFLDKQNEQGIFIYLSDHGDQVGDRNLFAKQTFFDSAAKIPLIFQGAGIEAGKKISRPVSIMDVGATVCDLVRAEYDIDHDGHSHSSLLKGEKKDCQERAVLSELLEIDRTKAEDESRSIIPARMARKGDWKLIVYSGYDHARLLFNLAEDPEELNNLYGRYPEIEEELLAEILRDWNPAACIAGYKRELKHYRLLANWAQSTGYKQKEWWTFNDPSRYNHVDR